MFPEAPRWRAGKLWFTDQHARRIVCMDMDGSAETVCELDDLPGGLGWLPDGRLLVVSMTQRKLLVLEHGRLQEYAKLAMLASFHCNDMLVDTAGCAYVGNFGFDLHAGAPREPAELILVTPDRRARIVARELVFPNGMVITPDGKTLMVAETFAARITAFTRESNGSLGERRLWADLGEASPDGVCLDAENRLWIAVPDPGEVWCVEEGGRVVQRVTTLGTPYACALGGPEHRTLFVTSSETDDPERATQQKTWSNRVH